MRVRPLSEMEDYEFPSGAFDVRGFEVRTRADREKVGKVEDVLLDDAGHARYLDVDLGLLRKNVLLPIGHARVDEQNDVVWIAGMTKEQLEEIPEWDRDAGAVDTEYERRVATAYSGAYALQSFYDRPEYLAGWWRGRDEEAAATVGTTEPRLRRLDELDDFEVADEDSDPRGWDVHSADGRKIGEVEELVVDAAALKVRYLDVELDRDETGVSRERSNRILVPVGYARLDTDEDRVLLDTLSTTDLTSIPPYEGEIDRAYEERVQQRFERGFSGESLYAHPRYRADDFYAPRSRRR